MSEPSSLVMRAHLPPDAYERFLASFILPVRYFDDWQRLNAKFEMAWLEEVQYGSIKHVRDWLTNFAQPPNTWPPELQAFAAANVHLHYDPALHCLRIDILEFSENDIEFVSALNVLRWVAHFKETPDSDDFILIYPYLWDHSGSGYVDAAIELGAGRSRILDPVQDSAQISHFRSLADAALAERIKALGPIDPDL